MKIASLKRPSAWIPVAMSAVALAVVLSHIAFYGIVREVDEGATAHTFQLLIVGEIPLVGYFAWHWLPKEPRYAWRVLAVQIVSLMVALAPVWYFNL